MTAPITPYLCSLLAIAACGAGTSNDPRDADAALADADAAMADAATPSADAATAVTPAAPCRAALDARFGRAGTVQTADPDEPEAVVVQPDGKIVAGFVHLQRFLPDGSPDPTFQLPPDPELSLASSALALAPDGKIITGFSSFVRRFNPDGSLDDGFGDHGIAEHAAGGLSGDVAVRVAALPDGSVLAGGFDNTPSAGFVITKWDATGHLDGRFGNASPYGRGVTLIGAYQLGARVSGLAVQADGGIILAGVARTVSADNQWVLTPTLLRVTPDGKLDPTFGTDGLVTTPLAAGGKAISALRLDPDGTILVVESADVGPTDAIIDADTALLLGRYTARGQLDPSFGDHGVARIGPAVLHGLGVLPMIGAWRGGYVVIVPWGADFRFGGFVVAGITHDGAPDPAVGGSGLLPSLPMPGIAQSATMTLDGKLLVLGPGTDRTLGLTRVTCE